MKYLITITFAILTHCIIAQTNEKALSLYRNFEFEKALAALEQSTRKSDQENFLKVKVLNCLARFEEANALKSKILGNSSNQSLKTEIKAYTSQVTEFHAPVTPHQKKKIVIAGKSYYIEKEKNGYKELSDSDRKNKIIVDKNNKLVYKITSLGGTAQLLNDGYTSITSLSSYGQKLKIINPQGKIIYYCDNNDMFGISFENGLFHIRRRVWIKGESMSTSVPEVINTSGKVVYNYKSEKMIGKYENNYAPYGKVELIRGMLGDLHGKLIHQGVVDKYGNEIINFEKIGCENCEISGYNKDGISAIVSTINEEGDKKYGLIDTKGNITWYNYNMNFSNYNAEYDLGVVSRDFKYGYANKARKVLIDFKFDKAFNFYNGRAEVKIKDKGFNYINIKGEYLSPVFFDFAWSFKSSKNHTRVELNGRNYLVDSDLNPLTTEIKKNKSVTATSSEEITNMVFQWVYIDDKSYEKCILDFYGKDYLVKNKAELISQFFNENRDKIKLKPKYGYDCLDENDQRDILKILVLDAQWEFIEDILLVYQCKINWNHYDLIDGEKETMIDMIDCILSDEEGIEDFDPDDLKRLKKHIANAGGKRGAEL